MWSVLFPERCVVCSLQGGLLCGPCAAGMAPGGQCTVSISGSEQSSTRSERLRVWYGCSYRKSGAHAVLRALKYKGAIRIIESLPAELVRPLYGLKKKGTVLVPVPLYKEREKTRGFNQAVEIARWCQEQTGIPLWMGLKRVKPTAQQATLGRANRWKNMEGAMRICKGVPPWVQRIIVVDDVCTTGSTMLACREALLGTGREILGYSIAHG